MHKRMVIAVTGNPGTGKTTFSNRLSKTTKIKNIEINDLAKKYDTFIAYDKSLDSNIVDIKKLNKNINNFIKGLDKDIILTGHLAADLKIKYDIAIILRLSLKKLAERLKKRGYSIKKIQENLLAEAYDYCSKIKSYAKEAYEVETEEEKKDIINYIYALEKKDKLLIAKNKNKIKRLKEKQKEHFSEIKELIKNKNEYKF